MKTYNLFIILGVIIAFGACGENKQDEIEPEIVEKIEIDISVTSIRQVTDISASVQAYIKCDSDLTEIGFVYSATNPIPRNNRDDCIQVNTSNLENDTVLTNLEDLESGTIYYIAAYADLEDTCFYSEIDTFGTNGYVTDVDGNTYSTVRINKRYWMAENFKTTKYNDGTDIPNLTSNNDWKTDTLGAFCWYDNLDTYKDISGALYNWYAVNTGNLAPSGWHVPSIDEWRNLKDYVDSDGNALKATEGWYDFDMNPDGNGTDLFGFKALPGGCRFAEPDYYTTFFLKNHQEADWWSKDESEEDNLLAKGVYLQYISPVIGSGNISHKACGYSVRCIKDE